MSEEELLIEFEKLQNHNLELQDIIINGLSNNINWLLAVFGGVFTIISIIFTVVIYKIGKSSKEVAIQQKEVDKQLEEVNQARDSAEDLLIKIKEENEISQENIVKLNELMHDTDLKEKLIFVGYLMDKEKKNEQKRFYLSEVMFYRVNATNILNTYLNNKKVEDMDDKEFEILELSNRVTSMATDLMSRINNNLLSNSDIEKHLEEIKHKYDEALEIIK